MVEAIADPIARLIHRFGLNILRARNLTAVSETILNPETLFELKDVLRSAVVFLHASLEDLLREAIRIRRPIDKEEFRRALQFASVRDDNKMQEKITVAELILMDEKRTITIIQRAIDAYLERRSFSAENDIQNAVRLLGFEPNDFSRFYSPIADMARRRHEIVHRSDRGPHDEQSHGVPTHITEDTVRNWTLATEDFGVMLLQSLRDEPSR